MGGGTCADSATGRSSRDRSADSAEVFDGLLTRAEKDMVSPRTPVEGPGEGAFAVIFDPEERVPGAGAFVVFGAGPPTVAVTVYAEDGEPAEAAMPAGDGRRAGGCGEARIAVLGRDLFGGR